MWNLKVKQQQVNVRENIFHHCLGWKGCSYMLLYFSLSSITKTLCLWWTWTQSCQRFPAHLHRRCEETACLVTVTNYIKKRPDWIKSKNQNIECKIWTYYAVGSIKHENTQQTTKNMKQPHVQSFPFLFLSPHPRLLETQRRGGNRGGSVDKAGRGHRKEDSCWAKEAADTPLTGH